MKNKQIFHFTYPFQTVFTCPNSMIKAEKHCAKYVQSENKNKFWKTKGVKQNIYKCVRFLLFLLLSTLWIYHFHCFPFSFLLLYLSFHLVLDINALISRIFGIFSQIPDQDFKKRVTLVQKRTLPFVTTAYPSVPNHCLHHLIRHHWYHQKEFP